MEKIKLIVMDYSVAEVHIFNYDGQNADEDSVVEFLENYHNDQGGSFKSGNIDYMIVDLKDSENRLPLYVH